MAVSKARMDRSDDPVSRSAPSLTKPRVRTDSVRPSMVFELSGSAPRVLPDLDLRCWRGGNGRQWAFARQTAATSRNIGCAIGGGGCAHRAGDEARDEDAVVAGVERDIEGLLGAARGAQLAAVARHLASDASWALLERHRRRAR